MLRCAPGRTDIALAANSGAYNAGIASGAALGGLVLSPADVRGTFLTGGLLIVEACVVLLGERLLPAPKALRAAREAGAHRVAGSGPGRRPCDPRSRTPVRSVPRKWISAVHDSMSAPRAARRSPNRRAGRYRAEDSVGASG